MPTQDSDHLHDKYVDIPRHWSPGSEKYTGGHSLLTALREGWRLAGSFVFHETLWRGATSPVSVYHFKLVKGKEQVTMSVVSSPFVMRLIARNNIRVIAYKVNDSEAVTS